MDQQFISRMEFCARFVGNVNTLAKKTNISQSGIRRYFQGSEPNRPALLAISEASNVKVEWLATGHGPVCDLDSPYMLLSKQELVENFNLSRRTNEIINLSINEAMNYYCDYYNKGELMIGTLPFYVMTFIPKLDWGDLAEWFQRNYTPHPKYFRTGNEDEPNPVGEDWIKSPIDLVVAVAREMPLAFGDDYSNLNRHKEAYVLKAAVDFLRQIPAGARNASFNPNFLRSYIQLLSQIYDQKEQKDTEL